MKGRARETLTSVKRSYFRNPVTVGLGGAALAALFGLNVVAFVRGTEAPWLLGSMLVADMLLIGVGILVATREVLIAEQRTETTVAQLESIVDSAMDAIITVDGAQRIVLFNRAAEQVFRTTRERALGAPLDQFLPPRFREAHRAHVAQFGRTGVTSRRMGDITTLWGLRADGEEFPLEASISQVAEEGRRYFTVILRDITRRKQAEEALVRQKEELRELSARVLEAREEEKARIARELHDELGQLLTALKMDLSSLLPEIPSAGTVRDKLDGMGKLLDQTVSATRRISADLRPLMLDDLGLPDAAQWLADDFARRSGVQVEVQMAGEETLRGLDAKLATALYRAIQESLTNIARHAGARNAWMHLAAADGEVEFEIEDDGRGISPEDLSKVRSLGLKGMRERIAYFGGEMSVERAPRGGTRVRVSVPARAAAAAAAA